MLVRVEAHPNGRRVHVWPGWRWHHGTSGLVLIAWGVRLIWQDRRDFPWI